MLQEPISGELSRILAIDYGKKRIGLALSDPLNLFAYPYITLTNNQNLRDELESVIHKKNISKIIIGYPFKSDGSKSEVIKSIEKFAKEIKKIFSGEIIFWDENYTSAIAKAKLLESVTKKSKRRDKGLLDQNSAAVILQEYIDSVADH